MKFYSKFFRGTVLGVLAFSNCSLVAQSALNIEDTRDVLSTSLDYNQIFKPYFKRYNSLALPATGSSFYTVLGFRGWLDVSGGKAHELAFGDDNSFYIRSGYNGGWEEWGKMPIEHTGINGSSIRIGNGLSSYDLNVPVGSRTGWYNIDFLTWRDVAPNQVGARITAERINNNNEGQALVQSMEIVFSTSDGWSEANLKERLRIKSNGDVGIGTSNTHGYKLAVNGNIRAKEIKVETQNWPDYVFLNSYKLSGLADLEDYIEKNQHLPDVPSASEVKEKGIDVGEMNSKLLKKIEELTLYIIQQGKDIEELKKKIGLEYPERK